MISFDCREVRIALFIAVIACFCSSVVAQLYYPANGVILKVDAPQLWYNGYWKHTDAIVFLIDNFFWFIAMYACIASENFRIDFMQPGWINGTMVKIDCTDCQGKILMLGNEAGPYDERIKEAKKKGAIALVVIRSRGGVPGQGMYFVTGEDQMELTIPVVEVYQPSRKANRIVSLLPASGFEVSIWPMENAWKKANDKVAFQIFFNVFLSGMELAIFLIGMFRVHQWTLSSCGRILSIGPICIILEMLGAVARFMNTIVDPFYTFRIYPNHFGNALITLSMPFVLASGVLLTFFWAETLHNSRIQASPFIAQYKKSAFFVIFLLFAGEIATSAIRIKLTAGGSFNPTYVTQSFYALVALVLIISYLMCAHEIKKRLEAGSNEKRRSYIRKMNIRFALSTAGYIGFCISAFLSAAFSSYPWGWKLVFNFMALSLNVAGLLQVYSLKPAKKGQNSPTPSPQTKPSSHLTHLSDGKSEASDV